MDEPLHGFEDENRELVELYERLIQDRSLIFFETDEYESIIEHYLIRGAYKKAQRVTDQALQQHPFSAMLRLKKAQLLCLDHKHEDALEVLEDALLYEPTNYEIFLQIAGVFDELERYAESIEYFEKALIHGTHKDEILLNQAYVFENWSKYDRAAEALENALKINPVNYQALYELAHCYDY